MHLKIFEKCVLKYLVQPAHFFFCTWINIANSLKNKKLQFQQLTDIDM